MMNTLSFVHTLDGVFLLPKYQSLSGNIRRGQPENLFSAAGSFLCCIPVTTENRITLRTILSLFYSCTTVISHHRLPAHRTMLSEPVSLTSQILAWHQNGQTTWLAAANLRPSGRHGRILGVSGFNHPHMNPFLL